MNEEERRLLNEIVKTRQEQNKNFKTFMMYALGLFTSMLIIFSVLTTTMVITHSNTIQRIETQHTQSICSSQEAIQELWRLYFETDYEYGEESIDIKIGD